MASEPPRRRTTGRARVVVTVAAPDGGELRARGLGAWLEKCAPARARGEVTVALVSDGRMRALNRAFRGRDYATDVLSFPVVGQPPRASRAPRLSSPERATAIRREPGQAAYLGDIVIATGVAARQADQAGHGVATELRILALHGLLHLLGYDHESDNGRMARAETRLRKKGGLREGLVERSR